MAWKLLPYQTAWVKDDSQLAIMQKTRRAGISWAEAYGTVMRTAEGRGNVMYQSYNHEMTRGFINDCAAWARELGSMSALVDEEFINEDDITSYRLALPSGKEIVAMPSSPRTLRSKGKPGDVVIIDEAAFVDDLAEVMKAALAFLMWGGSVRIISTHNGEASPYNSLIQDVHDGLYKGASVHTVDFNTAVEQGLYRRVAEVIAKQWSQDGEDEWRETIRSYYGMNAGEELDCIPRVGGGVWLTWEVIRKAEHADAGRPDLYANAPVFVGVDIARRRDLWVAVVLEKIGDVLWLREIFVEQNIPFAKQRFLVSGILERYRVVRVAVDQTGMGESVVEQLQDDHGSVIEGVLMTSPRRLAVATAIKECFEDARIRIYADDAMRRDLHSVHAIEGPTRAPRLETQRGLTDGHADRFWALALAAAAAADVGGPFDYHSAGRGRLSSVGGLQGEIQRHKMALL